MLKKTIRIIDKVVDVVIVCFFLPILCFGMYGIWDSQHINAQAAKQYETYRPEEDTSTSFTQLQELNPEVFGWLQVQGTHIDLPLVQGENNSKYVNTDVEGNFSLAGSLFLDCRNKKDLTDFNSIIYGHHMEKGTMFSDLDRFADADYMEEHTAGKMFFLDQWHDIEWFVFAQADAYDDILYNILLTEKDRDVYLQRLKEKAIQYRAVTLKPDDRFVTLSTCVDTATNGRYLLVGRWKGGKR